VLKVITLSYYHPMARFFCAIEDEWRRIDKDVEFLHVAVFPSAFLYFALHGRKVKAPTWRSLFSWYSSQEIDENTIDSMIGFHSADPAITKKEIFNLKKHARKSIFQTHKILKKYNPDIAIVSGDTRLPAEILTFLLKSTEIPIWYFEQGPYGTTIIDNQGVNANCSFRFDLAEIPFGKECKSDFKFEKKVRWNNKFYTLFDKVAIWQGNISGFVPPDIRGYVLRPIDKSIYSVLTRATPKNWSQKQTVLLALQVPEDANNIYHNPLHLNDCSLIKFVTDALPDDWNIIVREHPLYRKKYSAKFYQLVMSNERLCLSKSSLDDDMNAAGFTVTINSMTGLDAYLKGHKVAVVGDSFYDYLPGIHRIKSVDDLHVFFNSDESLSEICRSDVLSIFRDKYLISGHFSDFDLSFVINIVKKIIKNQS